MELRTANAVQYPFTCFQYYAEKGKGIRYWPCPEVSQRGDPVRRR